MKSGPSINHTEDTAMLPWEICDHGVAASNSTEVWPMAESRPLFSFLIDLTLPIDPSFPLGVVKSQGCDVSCSRSRAGAILVSDIVRPQSSAQLLPRLTMHRCCFASLAWRWTAPMVTPQLAVETGSRAMISELSLHHQECSQRPQRVITTTPNAIRVTLWCLQSSGYGQFV